MSPSRVRAQPLNGRRVLIVEDSMEVGGAFKRLLEQWGAEVVGPVATVDDARLAVSEGTIDTALVDLSLEGDEQPSDLLIDQLHDQSIRVVVLTGYEDGVVPLKEGKAAAVLKKPVHAPVLLKALLR